MGLSLFVAFLELNLEDILFIEITLIFCTISHPNCAPKAHINKLLRPRFRLRHKRVPTRELYGQKLS